MSLKPRELYAFGPYRLDAAGRVLFRDDRAIALAPKQIDTLIVLVRARGTVVDRETLVTQVWPDTFVEEAGLTRNVSLLRKAIEAGDEIYIETLPKRGYRFVAPVVDLSEPVQVLRVVEQVTSISVEEDFDAAIEVARPSIEAAAARPRRGPLIWVAATAMLVVVAGALGWMWRPADPSAGGVRSVAVLPFRHLNPSAADGYLSIGLADVLITRFANLSSVMVIPTSTVLPYAGKDAVTAGRLLGVDAVLDGTIRRAGDHIRATVQLIHVASGRPLWAGSFDEQATSLLEVEDRVTNAVASLLVPNLGREERARLAKRSTNNPEAWEAYLLGRSLWATRTVEDIERSVTAFEAAIRADPGFALAYAGLAQTRIVQGGYQYRWPREVYPAAKEAATRALELDGSLADAHGALAAIAWEFDWDWTTAERGFTRAIALNPNDATLHQWQAAFLVSQARWDEGLRAIDTAVQLDRQGFAPNSVRSILLYWMRRFQESIDQGAVAMQMAGNNVAMPALYSSASYHWLGQPTEARAMLAKARTAVGDIPIIQAFTARFEIDSGRRDRALQMLAALEEQRERVFVDPLFIAATWVDTGEVDPVLKWLRQGMADRSTYVPYLAVDPSYDAIRNDQRFRDIVLQAGLGAVAARVEGAKR